MSETRRPRLAIISSWNDSCGNASYTYVLKKEFEKHYDVEVLGLDLFLLRQTAREFRVLARKHITALARRLREFDYVNIQFEAGLYGANVDEIYRNVSELMGAAPNLILTMHRVDFAGNSIWKDLTLSVLGLSLAPLKRRRSLGNYARLYKKLVYRANVLSQRKNVWIKVHTKRERRVIQELYRFRNVIDAPLAFLDPSERNRVLADVRPLDLRQRYKLPPDALVMGAFGYISDYKGFEDLIRAIRIMPDNWYLLIVGSQHPMSIQPWKKIDSYLNKLLISIEEGASRSLDFIPPDMKSSIRLIGSLDNKAAQQQDVARLMDRVRFIGNVNDDEFTFMLRNADAVVLPYLEVGQSMSGVIALAIESGARLFCSNNLSFAEVRRYYGDIYGRFDVGNYVEIAQKVQHEDFDYKQQRDAVYAKYNIANLVDLHRRMFEGDEKH